MLLLPHLARLEKIKFLKLVFPVSLGVVAILGTVSTNPAQSATVTSNATSLLRNDSFEQVGASGSSTSFTGHRGGGTSAANNWYLVVD
jgi:hypothetical protein